jgi:glycerophosphoryl diester phosphodiesterase
VPRGPSPKNLVEIIAHRGFSAAAPENTLAAIEAAIAAGADALEFDVHVSRDGTPVLFHDATLKRTTDGRGPLKDHSLAELRALDAGSWFGRGFAGERIPSLAEALECVSRWSGRIYPEVKGYRGAQDLARMVDLAKALGVDDRTVFISLDWEALDLMRAHDSDVRIGFVIDASRRVDEAFERAAGDRRALLDFKAALLLKDPAVAARALDQRIELAVWTVDDPGEAERLLRLGVRRFTTNRVDDLVSWRESP